MSNFVERIVKIELIFDGRVIKVCVDDVVLLNGVMSKCEIVNYFGVVVIIVIIDEGKIVFVEQYCKVFEKVIIEILVGKLEFGEKFEVIVVCELEEEIGYVCENMEFIIFFYIFLGFVDEILYVYKVIGLIRKENKVELDEDEFVELMEVLLEEVIIFMKDFCIYDVKMMFVV